MNALDAFDTRVRDTAGFWPSEPDWMSYSSLSEIELCPRRWMLKRATYPALWTRSGYPDNPSMPALVGDIIHSTLDRVLTAFVQNGCDSTTSPDAVDILRSLGGYSGLIQQAIRDRVAPLSLNPRTAERLAVFETALRTRTAEMRQRVQTIVARSVIVPRDAVADGPASAAGQRLPVSLGSHAELDLQAEDMRWLGRADLLTVTKDGCEILDYKTGDPNEGHVDQLRVYALLWVLDTARNPEARRVTRLVASYRTREVVWDGPTPTDLQELQTTLSERTDAARADLRARPPMARPSDELCASCSVRHLCEEYWSFVEDAPPEGRTAGTWFGDVELKIERQHGPMSWRATVSRNRSVDRGTSAILRAPRENFPFRPNQMWRVINAALNYDDETEVFVVSLHAHAEIFELES